MEIKVTGCNNCPFRNIQDDGNFNNVYSCALNDNTKGFELIGIAGNEDRNGFNKRIPDNCPIKQQKNQQITIKLA